MKAFKLLLICAILAASTVNAAQCKRFAKISGITDAKKTWCGASGDVELHLNYPSKVTAETLHLPLQKGDLAQSYNECNAAILSALRYNGDIFIDIETGEIREDHGYFVQVDETLAVIPSATKFTAISKMFCGLGGDTSLEINAQGEYASHIRMDVPSELGLKYYRQCNLAARQAASDGSDTVYLTPSGAVYPEGGFYNYVGIVENNVRRCETN